MLQFVLHISIDMDTYHIFHIDSLEYFMKYPTYEAHIIQFASSIQYWYSLDTSWYCCLVAVASFHAGSSELRPASVWVRGHFLFCFLMGGDDYQLF